MSLTVKLTLGASTPETEAAAQKTIEVVSKHIESIGLSADFGCATLNYGKKRLSVGLGRKHGALAMIKALRDTEHFVTKTGFLWRKKLYCKEDQTFEVRFR